MIGLATLVTACEGTRAQPVDPRAPLGRGGAASKELELIQLAERPRVAVLTREGDPSAVIAAALHAPSDPEAVLALAEVVTARLQAARLVSRTRVDREAILVDADVADAGAARAATQAIQTALAAPIAAADLARVAARIEARVAALPIDPGPAAARVRACLGQSGRERADRVDVTSSPFLARVERARAAAFSRERAAFGVVGPRPIGEAALAALDSGGPWPSSGPPGSAAPAASSPPASAAAGPSLNPRPAAGGAAPRGAPAATAPAAAVPPAGDPRWSEGIAAGASSSLEVSPGVARLTVAIPVADPVLATAAAGRLGRSPSPLSARAEGEGFRVARVVGVASPSGGGCVAVTLEAAFSANDPADRDGRAFSSATASVVRRAVQELQSEMDLGPGREDVGARVARSERAPEGARLAAWWALSHPLDTRAARVAGRGVSLELALDVGEDRRSALDRAVATAAEEARAGIAQSEPAAKASARTTRVRLERGQQQAWVLVMNPCAAAHEAPHRWGGAALSALAAAANARAHARELGEITVEPVASPRGVGFVAHATPREGQSAAELARDLGESAAASFFVAPASSEELLLAEEAALGGLAGRWGKNAPGLVALGAAGGDRPGLVEPFGVPGRLARFDAHDLSARLRALARGPLLVSVLAREDTEVEGRAALSALDRWFTSPPRAACERPGAPAGSRIEVREALKGPSRVLVLLPVEPGPLAPFAAALLDGPSGLLHASLGRGAPNASSGATTRVGARVVGSPDAPRLLVDVTAPDETIADIERAAVALLERLSRGELPEAELARAIAAERDRDRQALSDPRERLIRLAVGGSADEAAPPAPADLKSWLMKNVRPGDATIVVARPE